MRFLIIIIFLIVSHSLIGQIAFFKFFGGEGYDYGHGITELEDSSILLTGSTSSFSGNSQVVLTHLDKFGNHLWSKDYGDSETEVGRRVLHKSGFGIYIAGYGNSIGSGGFDVFLMKTSEAGDLEWTKTYGSSGRERMYDAALTRDTGVIMVGETKASTLNEDWYIIRTNKLGDTLWTKSFGGNGVDAATCIKPINDSIYLVGGYMYNEDSLMTKGVIYTLHEDGTILSTLFLGSYGNVLILDMTIVNNQLDVVGTTFSDITNDWDSYRANIVLSTMIVTNEISIPSDGKSMDCISYADSGINRYIGFTWQGPSTFEEGPDLFIGLFSAELAYVTNSVTIADLGIDEFGQMIPTLDGGVLAVGSSSASESPLTKIFVVKIGPGTTYPTADGTMNDIVALDQLDAEYTAIYPNPATDFLTINSKEPLSKLRIISSFGQEVLTENCQSKKNVELVLTSLIPGCYFLEVQWENGKMAMRKIIISE